MRVAARAGEPHEGRAAGLIPVSPGALTIPETPTRERALAISAIDEQLMNWADAIIANLTPFRGIAADTGTTFELGFTKRRCDVRSMHRHHDLTLAARLMLMMVETTPSLRQPIPKCRAFHYHNPVHDMPSSA